MKTFPNTHHFRQSLELFYWVMDDYVYAFVSKIADQQAYDLSYRSAGVPNTA